MADRRYPEGDVPGRVELRPSEPLVRRLLTEGYPAIYYPEIATAQQAFLVAAGEVIRCRRLAGTPWPSIPPHHPDPDHLMYVFQESLERGLVEPAVLKASVAEAVERVD